MSSFFSTATKQKRVPSLETHHTGMALSKLHQHRIRARLGHRMVTATLAHEMTLTAFWHQIEHLFRHQRVVDQGVAAFQQPMGLQGEQLRISGSCSHQIHGSRSCALRCNKVRRGISHGRRERREIRPERSCASSSSEVNPPACRNASAMRFGARARGRGQAEGCCLACTSQVSADTKPHPSWAPNNDR